MIARFVGGVAAVFLVGFLTAIEMHPLTLPVAEPERTSDVPAPATTPTAPSAATPDVCERSRELVEAASDAPFAAREITRLPEVLPAGIGLRVRSVEQTLLPDAASLGRRSIWEAELEGDGFVRGVVRAWDLGDGRTVSVSVYEFETADGAFDFERFAVLDQSCLRARDVFTVEGVEGGTGVQVSWADGTESEQVSFVRGARRYLANVRGPAAPDRSLIVSVARALDRTAG